LRGDVDLLLRADVRADSGRALGGTEGAKAGQGDVLAGLELRLDRLECGREDGLDLRAADALGRAGDVLDPGGLAILRLGYGALLCANGGN
jgi:hypothetical protein